MVAARASSLSSTFVFTPAEKGVFGPQPRRWVEAWGGGVRTKDVVRFALELKLEWESESGVDRSRPE